MSHRRVIEEEPPGIIVAPFPGLMQGVPAAVDLPDRLRVIRAGESLDLAEFSAWLTEAGWARTDVVETPGEFAVRGGLIDLFDNRVEKIEALFCLANNKQRTTFVFRPDLHPPCCIIRTADFR